MVQRSDTGECGTGVQVRIFEDLLLVEDTGVARHVVFAALQPQQSCVLVGDHDVDDAVEVGATGNKEVLVGLKHDFLCGVPLCEDERTRTDRDEVTLQGSRVVRMPLHVVDRRAVIHDVFRHDRHEHVGHGDPHCGVWVGQVDDHSEVVGRVDRPEWPPHPGERVVVLDHFDRELHVG